MDYFQKREEFERATFDYDHLNVLAAKVSFGSIEAKTIVFAEGVHIDQNPWFRDLPMQGNKGEVLIIKCPGLELKQIVKSSVFLMPYQEDLFWVGATYDRDFESDTPSAEAKAFLQSKLESILKLPYEIIEQKSGIRPTTMDRRPFMGSHQNDKNVYVFNGMGSRASLVAPWAAQHLFKSMYDGEMLPEEMDVARFRD
jgi:glycine/D-amino acid oxidase-like deaminating enzyme